MLDPATAAQVARRYGLTIGDAAALARLCDTVEEAERVAVEFAGGAAPAADAEPASVGEEFGVWFETTISQPAALDLYTAVEEDHRDA